MEDNVKNTTGKLDVNKIAQELNRHEDIVKLKELLKNDKKGFLTIGSLEENGNEVVKIIFLDIKKNVKQWNLPLKGLNLQEMVLYIVHLNY